MWNHNARSIVQNSIHSKGQCHRSMKLAKFICRNGNIKKMLRTSFNRKITFLIFTSISPWRPYVARPGLIQNCLLWWRKKWNTEWLDWFFRSLLESEEPCDFVMQMSLWSNCWYTHTCTIDAFSNQHFLSKRRKVDLHSSRKLLTSHHEGKEI